MTNSTSLDNLSLTKLELLFLKNKEFIDTQKLIINGLQMRKVSDSRRTFKPVDKKPCYVCGLYKEIAQAHHLIPLCTQKDNIIKNHEYVWLCPSHHKLVHRCIDGSPITDSVENTKVLISLSKGVL